MKKKLIYLSSIILAMFFIFLFNTTSYAGYQEIDNLTYDVRLNEDGSAYVTETWDMYVSDTNTLFKTFKLDSSKYGKITNVAVKEIDISGNETNFFDTNEYAYHVKKNGFYALETKNNEFEIAWGVGLDDDSENKTYQISYEILDAVKTYNDCSEFYWQFIGNTNEIPVDKIKGTILLPKRVADKENLKVWAHGPLNGEIYAIDEQTVSFEVKYLTKRTMVEVRVAVAEDMFTKSTNKVNSNKLSSIIEEETGWAEAANRERDRLRKKKEDEEKLLRLIIIVAITAGIVITVFFIFKMIKYIKELRSIKKIKPEQELEYFRDFPDTGATAAEAAYLYYFDNKAAFKNNISKIVSATMLNLALKKAISFEQTDKDKVDIVINKNIDTLNLKNDEQTVYSLLVEVEKYTNKKENTQDTKISMKDIERYAKKNDRTFLAKLDKIEPNAQKLNEEKQNYDKKQIEIAKKWENKRAVYFAFAFIGLCFGIFIIPIFIAISCLICGIICNMIVNKTRTLTQKGVNEQEEWKALKRFMENFSLLDEREVPELALWEKYLVFATAFGVADKVLKQLKVKYPELSDDNYMLNNGYMYMYMMSRYNFDRMLTSSMNRAYSAGIQAKAAREAAAYSSYSSGSGGGGGFSGGGRPEVAVGGRNGWKIIPILK